MRGRLLSEADASRYQQGFDLLRTAGGVAQLDARTGIRLGSVPVPGMTGLLRRGLLLLSSRLLLRCSLLLCRFFL